MTEPSAQRTLVKSPPELWAEVSDAAALAKHLGEFGEIRIVRLEPETTVAWEGDRARGTVELEASGWGTKVTLTATPSAPPAEVQPVAEKAAPREAPAPPAPEVAAAPAAVAPAVATPPPEPPAPAAPEPVVRAEAVPLVFGPPPPEPPPPRKDGFLSRVFGRRKPPAPVTAKPPLMITPEFSRPPAAEEPAPAATPPVAASVPPVVETVPSVAESASPASETAAPVAAETRPAAGPALAANDTLAILTAALDDLGSAHRRPFSGG